MNKGTSTKTVKRVRRHNRVRARIIGTPERPRLSVFRGLRFMYAQIIDDQSGKTLLALHSKKIQVTDAGDKTGKVAIAYELGKQLATLAKTSGIETVVFDRGGYRYHGRVEAVAEGARSAGLQF